jgi:hypothetical protein
MTIRPLLFLDVDGPLNPYAAKPSRRPAGYTTHRMRPTGWDQPWQKPIRVWLNPDHGSHLTELPFDLVWATTWAAEANEWIAPRIGLPELPFIDWDLELRPVSDRMPDGTYWKTHQIIEYAAGRPFAWVDDEIGVADKDYVAAKHAGPGAPALGQPGEGPAGRRLRARQPGLACRPRERHRRLRDLRRPRPQPHESRFSLWHRKQGNIGPVQESPEMYWGKKHEPTICAEFADRHPELLVLPAGPTPPTTRRGGSPTPTGSGSPPTANSK